MISLHLVWSSSFEQVGVVVVVVSVPLWAVEVAVAIVVIVLCRMQMVVVETLMFHGGSGHMWASYLCGLHVIIIVVIAVVGQCDGLHVMQAAKTLMS